MKSNRLVAKTHIGHLDLATRVRLEAEITDSRSQALTFETFQHSELRLAQYLARAPWRQYLFNFLGPVAGKVVLDVACGYAMTPVMLALAGASVYAVDVAPHTLAMVQRMAEDRGVGDRVRTHVGPAEALPFADETFDLIFGGAALHHLCLELAGPELYRVLKRGGRGLSRSLRSTLFTDNKVRTFVRLPVAGGKVEHHSTTSNRPPATKC